MKESPQMVKEPSAEGQQILRPSATRIWEKEGKAKACAALGGLRSSADRTRRGAPM